MVMNFLFKHQLSTVALIQFIAMCFLGFANGANSIISTCIKHDECLSNALVSVIYWLLIAVWFGSLWVLAFMVEAKRSKRLARILIVAEILVALVSAFNAKHHPDIIGLVTSLVDLTLAVWVIVLAFRLMRAKGGRVVVRSRVRRRKTK